MLKSKTLNAIQVRIYENVRLMAELRARWEREEIAKKNSITKVCTITATNDADVSDDSKPRTIRSKRVIEENAPTSVENFAKTVKTTSDKSAEIFRSVKETFPVVH